MLIRSGYTQQIPNKNLEGGEGKMKSHQLFTSWVHLPVLKIPAKRKEEGKKSNEKA